MKRLFWNTWMASAVVVTACGSGTQESPFSGPNGGDASTTTDASPTGSGGRSFADGSTGSGGTALPDSSTDTPDANGSTEAGPGPAEDAGPVSEPEPCEGDGDCSAPTRFCDPSADICVECLSENHCTGGRTCDLSRRVCVFACEDSGDCSDPVPYCDPQRKECVECIGDANCTASNRPVCNLETQRCVECLENTDCNCLLPTLTPCCSARNQCSCGALPLCL